MRTRLCLTTLLGVIMSYSLVLLAGAQGPQPSPADRESATYHSNSGDARMRSPAGRNRNDVEAAASVDRPTHTGSAPSRLAAR
jgi:hypothetical protein